MFRKFNQYFELEEAGVTDQIIYYGVMTFMFMVSLYCFVTLIQLLWWPL